MRDLINQLDQILEGKKQYTQEKLPYDRQDLVPVMSKDTIDYSTYRINTFMDEYLSIQ